jgi:hypothetical protein
VAVAMLLAGCAAGSPRGGLLSGPVLHTADEALPPAEDSRSERPYETANERDAVSPKNRAPGLKDASGRSSVSGEDEPLDDWGEGWAGWPDGVGDGRPGAVPMSLDYFQGFLVRAGVPTEALPVDGRSLSPEQAFQLLPHLLATEPTLGDFGPRRMAAHLLLEVATGEGPVTRQELHTRVARFHRLLVLRPDGYLVRPVTGEAMQRAGEVRLADNGTLRAGRYEVGPFYAIEGGRLWPVDMALMVPRGAAALGPYVPDEGVLLPALEGAGLALVDTVEGLYRLVFHTGETLEALTRLPGAVHELVLNAPEYWDSFRHTPHGEQVRAISRLTTNVLLVVGTSGAGAAKAASWGGTLGHVAVPVFSLTGRGELALRLVAVPGRAVAVAGSALSATYVLHMATMGAGEPGSKTPPGEQEVKTGARGGPGSGKKFPETVKESAEQQAGGRCVFCGRQTTREPGPAQRNTDHAVPKSRGGNNTLDNAQNTCRTCNLDKGSKTTEEFLEGR